MNREEIKNLAKLARLGLSEGDVDSYQKDFQGILDYISTINSIKIDSYDDQIRGNTTNIMRSDDVSYKSGEFTDILLEAAPERDGDYVKVAKVL